MERRKAIYVVVLGGMVLVLHEAAAVKPRKAEWQREADIYTVWLQ